MALVYPLVWPQPARIERLVFEINRVQAASQTRGGVIQAAERGRSLWSFEATTAALPADAFEDFQAFVNALRGRLNPFQFYNVYRTFPRDYPNGWSGIVKADGTNFTGSATLDAASGYSLSLSGLPSRYQVRAGDMFAWRWKTDPSSRTLHRAVEDVRGTIAGTVTVQVEPDIPAGQTAGRNVGMDSKAFGLFLLTDPMPQFQRGIVHGEPVTIRAIQYLI